MLKNLRATHKTSTITGNNIKQGLSTNSSTKHMPQQTACKVASSKALPLATLANFRAFNYKLARSDRKLIIHLVPVAAKIYWNRPASLTVIRFTDIDSA